jgi:hypothetical protein
MVGSSISAALVQHEGLIEMDDSHAHDNDDNGDKGCPICDGELSDELVQEILSAESTGETWTREEYLALLEAKWGS